MSEKKLEITLTELFELVKGSTKPLEDEIELLKKQRDQAIKRASKITI